MSRWLRAQWDRFAGWGCVAVGGLLLIVGWYGMSGKPLAEQQLPYLLSGGLGGLFLLGLGAALLLSADLRDEWHKLDAIEEALRARDEVALRADSGPVGGSEGRVATAPAAQASPPPVPAAPRQRKAARSALATDPRAT